MPPTNCKSGHYNNEDGVGENIRSKHKDRSNERESEHPIPINHQEIESSTAGPFFQIEANRTLTGLVRLCLVSV